MAIGSRYRSASGCSRHCESTTGSAIQASIILSTAAMSSDIRTAGRHVMIAVVSVRSRLLARRGPIFQFARRSQDKCSG